MNVSFNGIGCIAATFKTSGKVSPGNIVKVTENGTVAACADGDEICRRCRKTVNPRTDTPEVLLGGYAEVSDTTALLRLASGKTILRRLPHRQGGGSRGRQGSDCRCILTRTEKQSAYLCKQEENNGRIIMKI